jgi:hypothetical protein
MLRGQKLRFADQAVVVGIDFGDVFGMSGFNVGDGYISAVTAEGRAGDG